MTTIVSALRSAHTERGRARRAMGYGVLLAFALTACADDEKKSSKE